MAKVTTLPELWWPLMEGPSVETPYCCVCGARWPLNRHHVVKRSAGERYVNGVRLPKPTLMLCGSGNASGCHGKAHQGRLHFRYVKQPWHEGWKPLRPSENSGGFFLVFSVVFLAIVVIYKPTRGRGPQVEKGTKMQKLTYKNEDQLHHDAVKAMLGLY